MQNYRRAGQGPTVVLQHGFLGGSGYWLPQIQYLCPRFDVIAPDLPGFGSSGEMEAPNSIDGFVAALIGLMDALGVAEFSLVGHSMGGSIAQQLALDHPDRLERVVFYGTSSIGEIPGRFETIVDSIDQLQKVSIEETADRFAKSWFLHGDSAPAFDFCLQAGKGATVAGATNALEAVRGWSADDRLGEIATPALVICGDGDRGTPPQRSMRLFEGLPDARLAILPGAAHNLHLERSELFNQVIGDFLTDGM
ncbi:MAG: alpha/beta hydrolase [Alphaproteobacteria bacterium]|nr:alpha/beta hydrolase [Alphaproteobacteria bacterium]|tara:strand:+ start:3841 stop:4596 length:756 start_codon:yes stop_codon:yes gene_type:complete